MWIALGADSTVARQIMEMIMEKLNVIVPYVDKKESILKPGMTKVATNQPLAVSDSICVHEFNDILHWWTKMNRI